MNEFTTIITLYSNKFELKVNIDALNTVSFLNIGSRAKNAITAEIRKMTGKMVNVSNFKIHLDLINKKLEENGLNINAYVGSNKSKKRLLVITYLGVQIKRDKKIDQLIK